MSKQARVFPIVLTQALHVVLRHFLATLQRAPLVIHLSYGTANGWPPFPSAWHKG